MPDFNSFFAMAEADTDFDVSADAFDALEIRDADKDGGLHYFYHRDRHSLIKNFIIDEKPTVSTLLNITLIKKNGVFSPRVRLWKRSKSSKSPDYEVPENVTTRTIKASVDTGDGHENFWRVVSFVQNFAQVEVPDGGLRFVAEDEVDLAQFLQGRDKDRLVEAMEKVVGGQLTESDLIRLANRRAQLAEFYKMLTDSDFFETCKTNSGGSEAAWQKFFEKNQWIFGYGLQLVSAEAVNGKLEQITTGTSILTGGGKRSDAVMRTKGFISSLLLVEIKTHLTDLLTPTQYRAPDVYSPSKELVGGVAQVQKTAWKFVQGFRSAVEKIFAPDGSGEGVELVGIRPRQVLVIGVLSSLAQDGSFNREKVSSFELFRRGILDVEVITFDELYERARFIVGDGSASD